LEQIQRKCAQEADMHPNRQIFIVDDIRYPNEFDWVARNGVTVFVHAGNSPRIDRKRQMYQHESERMAMRMEEVLDNSYTALRVPTFVIHNYSTPEDLGG